MYAWVFGNLILQLWQLNILYPSVIVSLMLVTMKAPYCFRPLQVKVLQVTSGWPFIVMV